MLTYFINENLFFIQRVYFSRNWQDAWIRHENFIMKMQVPLDRSCSLRHFKSNVDFFDIQRAKPFPINQSA